MNNFWDERYAMEGYVYGATPNVYFKQELEKLTPGKILLPGEGEGRNAVFAATQGWKVTAFDSSLEGKKKAEKLALKNKVYIEYRINDYENIQLDPEEYNCLALIYTHMPGSVRKKYHQKLVSSLNPGGILILECFSKKQISNNTGGPKNRDMLYSKEELQDDFSGFTALKITETEIDLNEGKFHKGKAFVIRIYGIK